MKKFLLALSGFTVLFLSLAIWGGCVEQRLAPEKTPVLMAAANQPAAPAPAAAPAPKPAAPAPARKIAPAYQKEVAPLTTEQCAQCHLSYYNLIRNEGGKHQLDCTYCHKTFHTFHPGKTNYEDILPKCGTCHGLAHGEKLAKCAACHSNAHAPTKNMTGPEMDAGCNACHGRVTQELLANKSKHTDVACSDCHTVHRSIPVCATCHQPHLPAQTNADCLVCHPVHRPLVIAYPVTTPQESCGVCHTKAMDQLRASNTKHTALTCAKCHPKHRDIIRCQGCHGQAHNPAMLKGFKGCGDCHSTAHNMPKS